MGVKNMANIIGESMDLCGTHALLDVEPMILNY